jgi:hypothetical protein
LTITLGYLELQRIQVDSTWSCPKKSIDHFLLLHIRVNVVMPMACKVPSTFELLYVAMVLSPFVKCVFAGITALADVSGANPEAVRSKLVLSPLWL